MFAKICLTVVPGLLSLWGVVTAAVPSLGPRVGTESSYAIYLAGKRVGRTAFRFEKKDTVFVSHLKVRFNLQQASQQSRVAFRADLTFCRTSLLPIAYHLTSWVNGTAQASIQVQVKGDSAVTTVKSPVAGKQRVAVRVMPGTLILDNNFCLDHYQLLVWRFLRSGSKQQSFPFLVPQIVTRIPAVLQMELRKQGEERLTLEDSSFACWKLVGTSAGGLQLIFFVSKRDGILLRWEVPAQASVVELELSPAGSDTLFSSLDEAAYTRRMLDRFYIKSYTDLGNWRNLEYLRLKVHLEVAAFGEPCRRTPWQTFEGQCVVSGNTARYDGIFTVHMVRTRGPGRWINPEERSRFRRELAAEPEVQVDHSEIRQKAHVIAGDAPTPWQAVQDVCHCVATEIRYEVTGADALTCLRSRKGDCGPKAKLAIALLRSLGIPARLAGGVLYVGERWGQHNWVEVFLGDELGWVPVDPATGETQTFSAAHLTLWQGWAGSLGVGAEKSQIEVLEFRKKP